ncbi:leucine rich repeat domain-containing protein [Phthorimaea operculella]|nr:leucine rich repeat domain-containing protein [Phthorimaea operculella]
MFAKACVLCVCAVVLPVAAYYFGTQTSRSNSISSTNSWRTGNSWGSSNRWSNSYSSAYHFGFQNKPPKPVSQYSSVSQYQHQNYISYHMSYDPEGGSDLYPLYNVDLQRKIEQYHNDFRRQVQPPASNMLYMHWNQEAAIQAQKYAEVCRFVEHNSWKDRRMKNYLTCGQNLFGSQVKLDWYTAIESWFSEHVNFTYGSPNNVFPDIGHYTSMVWATSHQVGCGVAFCKGGPWKQFYNYVCHYCPSGNYDYNPYKIGTPCGDCPYDCVNGLCTNSCPSLDTLGNCEELLVEPDICYSGDCDATCWCRDKIYKNYPWYSTVFPIDRATYFPPPPRLRPNCNAAAGLSPVRGHCIGSAARVHLPRRSDSGRAMVCDSGLHGSSPHSPPARRKSLRRLASTRGFRPRPANEHGYLRIFDGLEPFAVDAPSKLVKVTLNTTVEDINKKLGFNEELTVWIQIGGDHTRRLELDEYPLRIQEQYLVTQGWRSEARRLRLAVDPELRHSLRFCAGPGVRSGGVLRSGTLYVLKGHVFPQWKPRPAHIIGSRLHMCGSTLTWEMLELSGGTIELCQPKAQRLVLCVKSRCHSNSVPGDPTANHVFFGFSTIWERNMWFCWLKEATQSSQPPSVLDLSGGGRASLGAALTQHAAGAFTVRTLKLCRNALSSLPPQAWTLQALTHLDISDNRITELPEEICQLTQLEELRVSENELRSIDCVLSLPRLRTLVADHNLIQSFGTNDCTAMSPEQENKTEYRAPLTSVDLRNNRLKGSIILGNYEHLVSLDISYNSVEVLVVSALRGLRELYAAHNTLQHLSLHGSSLRILKAPHNQLESLTTTVPPINLVEIDVTDNKLTSLPQWLSGCSDLTTLHASKNQLTSLPEHLFCSELSSLSSLHLAHNKISNIPSMPRLRAPLKEFILHDNCIQSLPENFFSVCDRLCVLNLSNNRLTRLPPARGPSSHCLERLYLTANCLTDEVADVIIAFRGLKILHMAYNCLTSLPDSCVNFWPDIEELVLSGNSFTRLPENLPNLNNIRIVRAHSNKLRTVPMFACSASIKILDFAHNELDSIDLRLLAPKQLKFLDISCNQKLQVDPTQFSAYRCQRPLSLVDVTGRNSLLYTPQKSGYHEEMNGCTPWNTGFSECPNKSLQLCCAQIRLPSFCNKEGLFAIIDGETDMEVPKILQTSLPGLLLEEKSIKETVNEYMKYVVLSAHRELKEKGQRKGACLIMCHLSPMTSPENGFGHAVRRYTMRLANVGDTRAVLSRRNGPLSLGIENNKRLGYSTRYPNTVPDPDVIQTVIKEDDEFLILGNGKFWNAVSIETAVSEVRAERNPVLAAKRLQDLAQSYGVEDCISVMIIRFDAGGRSDVDLLMPSPTKTGSDRSSPSGQSDRPPSEAVSHQHYASVRSSQTRASERRSCRGGVARAIRVRVEEDKEDDPRPEDLPEEQFKCWEYMLEQNTQMLFDKELDNLSKGIKSNDSLDLEGRMQQYWGVATTEL